ncbi:hypothetical protein Cgig2_030879 [Carnegiea gigantea]|uniref:Uncharacterized protein n=1 Tax=Carnegiea gigantea TaxID=171969 RepID=A0A9Q1KF65_9CARY|nr:hypothetical protein Cgig2_030879 [Carnegiea gigantea]
MLGRVIRERSRRKVMLLWGRKDCVWVKENMGVLEVLRVVEEAMGEGIRGRRIRLELLPLGRDGDVKKLMKENDEYAYLYVARSEGPCVGRVHGNEACEEQWRGGCTDCGRVGATVNTAGDVARAVDGKVVTEQVVRDVAQRNIREGEEVDEAAIVEERDRIEKKLRKTLDNIGSVAYVNLTQPLESMKLWVYDYVNDCYKAGSQNMIYMNNIHPIETHDSATLDNATGLVAGGEALDDGYNQRILPLLNPRPQGRPRKRRIESQRQGV